MNERIQRGISALIAVVVMIGAIYFRVELGTTGSAAVIALGFGLLCVAGSE